MTATVLKFDEELHRYSVGDVTLPSVTQILKETGLIDVSWFTEEARLRGSYVHQATQYLDEDDLAEETVDPRYAGYVEAYRRFLIEVRPIWESIEGRVCDVTLGYAGTYDRLGLIAGRRWLVDIKTGDARTAGIQTAGYRRCLVSPHSIKRAALRLHGDGTYHFDELSDRRDEGRFLAALTVWQTKQELA